MPCCLRPVVITAPWLAANLRDLAARRTRALHKHSPPKREQGMPGCALHQRSRVQDAQRKRTRAYRFSGNTPASPTQWLYGLCRDLPGDEFVLSPSSAAFAAARPGRVRVSHRRLGTSNGCQNHTVLPYAKTSFVLHALQIAHEVQPALRHQWRADALASTTSRPAFVTTRDRPSSWNGMAAVKPLIWGLREAEDCPSCQSAAIRRAAVEAGPTVPS